MTATIIITGLVIALSASILRNWLQFRDYEKLKSRYTQLYEMQTETLAAEIKRAAPPASYDPDDYTELTSHMKKHIGERS